nr:DUF3796 domain-containing protein [uncultured Niameybacter sp.]
MKKDSSRTRRISPWLGILGFLGFIGPIIYSQTGDLMGLVFLGFFGFFSFYFEGKMSGTLRDERFKYNEQRVIMIAGRVNSVGTVFALIMTVNYIVPRGNDIALSFLVGSLSLLWAVNILLQMSLLYYFEHKE